jgi:hypothetical protein
MLPGWWMDEIIREWSTTLFGGWPRLQIAAAVGRTSKAQFTTADIVNSSGMSTPVVSDHLNMWVKQDNGRGILLVRDGPKGSGRYRRISGPFWSGCVKFLAQLEKEYRPVDLNAARAGKLG